MFEPILALKFFISNSLSVLENWLSMKDVDLYVQGLYCLLQCVAVVAMWLGVAAGSGSGVCCSIQYFRSSCLLFITFNHNVKFYYEFG